MQNEKGGLIRAMGRWTLTALVVNTIVGSGIFGLPSVVAAYVGRESPLAFLLAAAAIGIIIGCFAEVASQFDASGGPYLYVREALGTLPAIEVAWLLGLTQLTASAAAANLFTDYLAGFWPATQHAAPRLIALSVLIGFLAAVNYIGVISGAIVNNVLTVAKLLPLFAFAIAGGISVLQARHGIPTTALTSSHFPVRNWLEAVLILLFAFGGFEGAVMPMAEAIDPRRDVPFALYTALGTTAALYFLIQIVVVVKLPDAAATSRPLADAARQLWGSLGARLISVGALISVYGNLSAHMLRTPRLTFALGERGDWPHFFACVHRRFRTPHNSILVFAAIVWSLAAIGTFKANVLISAGSRLIPYGLVCASLPVLRRKHPNSPAYRLPAGDVFSIAGVVLMVALCFRISRGEAGIILVAAALGLANWVWVRVRSKRVLMTPV